MIPGIYTQVCPYPPTPSPVNGGRGNGDGGICGKGDPLFSSIKTTMRLLIPEGPTMRVTGIIFSIFIFLISPSCTKKVTTVAPPTAGTESAPAKPADESSVMPEERSSPAEDEAVTHAASVHSRQNEAMKLDAELEPLKKQLETEESHSVKEPSAPATVPSGKETRGTKSEASVAGGDVPGDKRAALIKKIEELDRQKVKLRNQDYKKSDRSKPIGRNHEEIIARYEKLKARVDPDSPRGKEIKRTLDELKAQKEKDGTKMIVPSSPSPIAPEETEVVATETAVEPRLTGAAAASVKAAAHDDNEEIISYREYCGGLGEFISPYEWDVSERYLIRLTHSDSSTAWNHLVALSDKSGATLFSARTPASGEIVLLPKIDLGSGYRDIGQYRLSIDNSTPQPVKKGNDDLINFTLSAPRRLPDSLYLQICFLMDVTGSMSDEIAQLQDVIFSIHSRIIALPTRPRVQFSIVEYRDIKDSFIVRGHHFTGNIDEFQMTLEKVSAAGGGDFPEDIEAGFAWCLDSLKWRQEALKFIFLVADAPPHLDEKDRNYLDAAKQFRRQAIMVCPIGASGLDFSGEYVFRQIALLTKGQFVFLHYGESGESEGKGTTEDPGKVSHHTGSNYNARRLDDIVVDIVSGELGYLTPRAKIVRTFPQPKEQAELLDLRMDNLLRQVVVTMMPPAGKSIVLAPFSVADPTLGELAEYLWESALEKLPSCTDASIIERQRIADLLKEKAISLSGLTEDQPAVDVGKMLNADYMILSNLHFLGAMRLCHMRLVDCATGAVVRAARVRL